MAREEENFIAENIASQIKRVRYLGSTSALMLTHDKIYDVLSVEKKWYRVIDDSGDDYLYPPECFEIVSDLH